MSEPHIIIIGGGLAGMAAGCYARRSGYRTTIVEHNLALGGVCTAWQRGPYTVDGCIHWLTGGAFEPLYRELGILPAVALRTLDTWVMYRDLQDGAEVLFTRNLDALIARLGELAPEDRAELARVREGAHAVLKLKPPIDAGEPISVRETLRSLWDMRGAFDTLVHFRKSTSIWANDHLKSPRLRRMFTELFPDAPAFFMLMVLAYLEQGYLSRPIGGTAAFRDALENSYCNLGGAVMVHATVDEVLVSHDRARGVRLADGTLLEGDLVISTASAPETVLRLLGGRYDAEQTRERMKNWKMFEPIVLASFGVEHPYPGVPALMLIDHVAPFDCGGKSSDRIMVRMCNDDASFAPPGHSVVQAVVGTDYDYWATRGTRYGAEKDALAQRLLETLEPQLPGLSGAMRMIDLATPLTFWNKTRSWRGAFEGWMPNADGIFSHVKKKLAGLSDFYMAGQWVEPGGGVPMAVMSGRQAVQLICADQERPFVAS
jgi:phytoene dehydrogenase-like protein